MKNRLYILYVLIKITVTTENRSTVLIFNFLVIKNHLAKKAKSFFVHMEGFQVHHDKVLVLEERTFHWKFSLYFNLVLPNS